MRTSGGRAQEAEDEPPCEDGVHLMDNPGQRRLFRSIRLTQYEAERDSSQ